MREFDFLKKIFSRNNTLGREILIPPGDDLAMLRINENTDILMGVDQLLQGCHFPSDCDNWQNIGRKAVARSLSDIAAMAAQPVASLATALLPRNFDESHAEQLFESMRTCALEYNCPLVGGDIAFSNPDSPLHLTVTVFAQPGPTNIIIKRSTGQVSDSIYITGKLGSAWQSNKHYSFIPRINLALELVNLLQDNLHAMIDISDGLGRDLDHIAESSNTAALIHADKIPLNPDSTWQNAVSDGEDYELCFTVSAGINLPENIHGTPITKIGNLTEPTQKYRTAVNLPDGCTMDASHMGWEHNDQ